MGRFWFAGGVLLLCSFAAWAQDALPVQELGTTESSQRLDAQTERLINEILLLGGEMEVLTEKLTLSDNAQLLVLVSVEPIEFFELSAVQLKLDGKDLAYHQYMPDELLAMRRGGAFRLFWDDVKPGRHELAASVFGRLPRDPDFQRHSSLSFISGTGHRVVEIRVAPGKSQAFPDMFLKEWK